ncbi:M48 family metallopeptidase [Chitinophaga sp. RAB17]|uniref:M48 family metallopeptidase n=1 Tax=Chitinophaga sp. RAB17 TaxID=3233049 RepID=UPI003F8E2697
MSLTNMLVVRTQAPRVYKARESHYYQGKRYLLTVTEHTSPQKVVLKTKTYLDLYVKPGATTGQRHAVITEWYRQELKKSAGPLMDKWEKVIGRRAEDWQIKQMKTKWGSCNTDKKRILLNLELAKKPLICLEYIIVHELVHLLERYHNDRFLALMNEFMPQWKFYREELNRMPVSRGEWEY